MQEVNSYWLIFSFGISSMISAAQRASSTQGRFYFAVIMISRIVLLFTGFAGNLKSRFTNGIFRAILVNANANDSQLVQTGET